MAYLIESICELDSYIKLIQLIKSEGTRSSRYLEINNCLLTIPFSKDNFEEFLIAKDKLVHIIGDTAKSSEIRAKRVFEETNDRLTKPSYRKRLVSYPEPYNEDIVEINQIENIIYELSIKPLSSTLVFNFYRPQDNLYKKRQGYVPCPVSGDFKFRNNKLSLNIFFRSQDALNFYVHDVYHFRKLQFEVLEEVQKIDEKNKFSNAKIGSLNFHYSRVFIPLSMEWTPRNYVNKPEIMKIIDNLEYEIEKTVPNNV